MKKYAATWIAASAFALFHIVVVAAPVVSAHGGGEAQGFAVLVFDMPLVRALSAVDRGAWMTGRWYVFIVAVVGTLMYAAAGAVLGFVIDRLRIWLGKR